MVGRRTEKWSKEKYGWGAGQVDIEWEKRAASWIEGYSEKHWDEKETEHRKGQKVTQGLD